MRAPASYSLLLLASQYGVSHAAAARHAMRLCAEAAHATSPTHADGYRRSARIMAGLARAYHEQAAKALGVTLGKWGQP